MLVVALALALLAVLAARADAQPFEDDEPIAPEPLAGDPIEIPARIAVPIPIPISPEDLGRVSALAPPVSEVVAAAYRTARLDHDPTPSFRIRSRLAGLVPTFSLRVGSNAAWHDVADPTISHTTVFDVRGLWRLERLLFDPNEIRIEALSTSRRRERRRIAADAIHTYYAWLRARAAAAHDGRWSAHAGEVTAELDALTDGWFSEILAKPIEQR